MPLLMGVDIGTSSVKAQVVDDQGRRRALCSQAVEYARTGGGAEFNPDCLWERVAAAIQGALSAVESPREVVAVSCVSVGESGVLVDGGGEVCCPSLAWYDPRPRQQMAELAEEFGEEELTRRSGMRLSPIAGLCKLMWMRDHRPDALERARHWLHVSEFAAFRLCGVAASDFSHAGRTLLLDFADKNWNGRLLADRGLPDHLLPPILDNGAALGLILPDVADALGLSRECQVAVGGHDHIIGMLACGAFDADTMLDSIGTAEAVALPIPTPLTDGSWPGLGIEQGMLKFGEESLCYLVSGLQAASASIDWFRENLSDDDDFATLAGAANKAPPGSNGVLFLPYLRGISPPHPQPGTHGIFLNLGSDAGRGEMYRALLEGLAFDARKMADLLLRLARLDSLPGRIVVSGGSSQNRLLLQIKANVFDRPLQVSADPQSVSLGAAMLAGLGGGVFPNWRESVRCAGPTTTSVLPDQEQIAHYQAQFVQDYLPAVTGLQSMVGLRPGEKTIHRNLCSNHPTGELSCFVE